MGTSAAVPPGVPVTPPQLLLPCRWGDPAGRPVSGPSRPPLPPWTRAAELGAGSRGWQGASRTHHETGPPCCAGRARVPMAPVLATWAGKQRRGRPPVRWARPGPGGRDAGSAVRKGRSSGQGTCPDDGQVPCPSLGGGRTPPLSCPPFSILYSPILFFFVFFLFFPIARLFPCRALWGAPVTLRPLFFFFSCFFPLCHQH